MIMERPEVEPATTRSLLRRSNRYTSTLHMLYVCEEISSSIPNITGKHILTPQQNIRIRQCWVQSLLKQYIIK